MKKLILFILCVLVIPAFANENRHRIVSLRNGWHFTTENNPRFSDPSFDDSDWDEDDEDKDKDDEDDDDDKSDFTEDDSGDF